MAFHAEERQRLLAVRGIGPTVVARLEEAGIDSFASLARCEAEALCSRIAAALGATCWRNSPQARAAIADAIAMARRFQPAPSSE